LVIDHYAKLGFSKIQEDDSGLARWELLTEAEGPEAAPMKVVSLFVSTAEGSLV
jgi:hypothetical protein